MDKRQDRMRGRRGPQGGQPRRRTAVRTTWAVGAVAVLLFCAACTQSAGSPSPTTTVITGTSTTIQTTTTGTTTVVTTGTVTLTGPTLTSTSVITLPPSTIGPPPPTAEPAAVPGPCPYLSADDVTSINGQHHGATSLIAVEPYPVCTFTRSDGSYLASTRIVQAATPAEAAAAVNQHAPIDQSNPASDPAGWTGGAMSTPKGIPGNDQVRSVYAVSKGTIAIIAMSNQPQSIKGRQMVDLIVKKLGL